MAGNRGRAGRKEGNISLNNTLNSFCLRLFDIGHMTIETAKAETRCRHMGYSLRLVVRDLLYAPYST